MPRRALVDSCVVALIGRPMLALVPAPASATGVVVAVASASRRANSRSSTGPMLASMGPHSARSFLAGLAAVERKHLGWVQQPLGVEHGLDPHLHGKVGFGELDRHEIALLDAHPVLAGEAAAGGDAELENLLARLLGTIGLCGVVGIVKHE